MQTKRKLHVDDWVEVRSKEEILQILDGDGRLEGMPFMPEMFTFCERKFQVYKQAHKTCDCWCPPEPDGFPDCFWLVSAKDDRERN